MKRKLNEKQLRFVEEYLIDLNATQAATRAGYSAKTAGNIAHLLLKKLEIQEAIGVARKKMQEHTQITAALKRERLWQISGMGMEARVDQQGNTMPASLSAAVSAISELNKMDGDLATIKTENKTVTYTHEEWLSQLK